MSSNFGSRLEKGIGNISKIFSTFGSLFLVLMMMILVAEVCMRALGSGVLGSYEIVELAMVPLVFLSFANAQSTKKNVEMDLIYNLLPKKIHPFIDLLNYLVMILVTVFIIGAVVVQSLHEYSIHNATAVLYLPIHIFMFMEALGFILLLVVLISDVIIWVHKMVTGTYAGRKTATEMNELLGEDKEII